MIKGNCIKNVIKKCTKYTENIRKNQTKKSEKFSKFFKILKNKNKNFLKNQESSRKILYFKGKLSKTSVFDVVFEKIWDF